MPPYTLAQVDALCAAVAQVEEADADTPSETSLRAIRALTEALVWSDQHSEAFFDRIIARDFMNVLERIVTNALVPTRIKMQVLQCVTILVMNLQRVSSVYLLCSNNHLNRMIAIEVDTTDDETVSLYVSFLKSLAVRLNESTVQFFYEASTNAFPLFDKAVQLLGSRDAMVRTAARQIVLSLAQLRDRAVRSFVLGALPEVVGAVVDSLRHQLTHLTDLTCTSDNDSGVIPRRVLQQGMEDMIDDVLYLNDLASATQPYAAEVTMALVEQHLLRPIARVLLFHHHSVSPCDVEGKEEDDDDVRAADEQHEEEEEVWRVAARPALALVVHWLTMGDAPPCLRTAVTRVFLQPNTTTSTGTCPRTEDDGLVEYAGVVGVLLRRPCLELYDGVLALLLLLLLPLRNNNNNDSNSAAHSDPVTSSAFTSQDATDYDSAVACLAETWCAARPTQSKVGPSDTSLHDFVQHAFLDHLGNTSCLHASEETRLASALLTMLYHLLHTPFACRVRTLYCVLHTLHRVLARLAEAHVVPASLPRTVYATAVSLAQHELLRQLQVYTTSPDNGTTATNEAEDNNSTLVCMPYVDAATRRASATKLTLYTAIKQCWPRHTQLSTRMHSSSSTSGGTSSRDDVFDAFLPLASSSQTWLSRLRPPVPLVDRLPCSAAEKVHVACMAWLCLSCYSHRATTAHDAATQDTASATGQVDCVRRALVHALLYPHPSSGPYNIRTDTLPPYLPGSKEKDEEDAVMYTPCEVVSVVKESGEGSSVSNKAVNDAMLQVPCGALLDLCLTATELLFLQPTHSSACSSNNSSGDGDEVGQVQERVVMLAFDLDSILLSVHAQRPFCLVLVYVTPALRAVVHLVVRRALVARRVVQCVQRAQQTLQCSALALCDGLMAL